jgi:hypothetical protein
MRLRAIISLAVMGVFLHGCAGGGCDEPQVAHRKHHRKIKVYVYGDGSKSYRGDDSFWYYYVASDSNTEKTWVRMASTNPALNRPVVKIEEEEEEALEAETTELQEEPDPSEVSEDGAADSGADTSSSGESSSGDSSSSDSSSGGDSSD